MMSGTEKYKDHYHLLWTCFYCFILFDYCITCITIMALFRL